MSRFEFRVWDKIKKSWVSEIEMGIALNGSVIAPDKTWMEHDLNDLVIMQSTGLKDSKGKKIFEGDILKWGEKWGYPVYESVTYSDHMGCWSIMTHKLCEIIKASHYLDPDPIIPSNKIDDVEVIGNIHENPELLEVGK